MLEELRKLFLAALKDNNEAEQTVLVHKWNEEVKHIQEVFDRMTDKKTLIPLIAQTVQDCNRQKAQKTLEFTEHYWSGLPSSEQKDLLYEKIQTLRSYLAAVDTIRDIESKKLF